MLATQTPPSPCIHGRRASLVAARWLVLDVRSRSMSCQRYRLHGLAAIDVYACSQIVVCMCQMCNTYATGHTHTNSNNRQHMRIMCVHGVTHAARGASNRTIRLSLVVRFAGLDVPVEPAGVGVLPR